MYDNSTLLSTRFPQKLWKIVNECKTSAISWNTNGTSILLDYKKFHEQYLSPGNKIFKTSNITSFIRQLNLYGFRKVTSHNRDPMCNMKNPDIHEFTHDYFNRDCENLLTKVCRKASRKSKKIHQQHHHYYRHHQHQHQHQHDEAIKYFHAPTKNMKVYQQGLTRLQMCQLTLRRTLDQAVADYQHQKKLENEYNYFNGNHSTYCVLSYSHLQS